MNTAYLKEEDRRLLDHTADLCRAAQQRYQSRFTPFLDERQQRLVQGVLREFPEVTGRFYGGWEEAARAMLGIFPPYEEPAEDAFPLCPVTLLFRREDSVGHRDILGALMGLRIKREAVGDILPGEGFAVLFVTRPVLPVVLSELTKIGRVGANPQEGLPRGLPPSGGFVEIQGTVSSLRLDSLVALLTRESREREAGLVRAGLVTLEYEVCTQVSHPVAEGDTLSVRGYGKYVVDAVGGVSKKGRIHLRCKKFQ